MKSAEYTLRCHNRFRNLSELWCVWFFW